MTEKQVYYACVLGTTIFNTEDFVEVSSQLESENPGWQLLPIKPDAAMFVNGLIDRVKLSPVVSQSFKDRILKVVKAGNFHKQCQSKQAIISGLEQEWNLDWTTMSGAQAMMIYLSHASQQQWVAKRKYGGYHKPRKYAK